MTNRRPRIKIAPPRLKTADPRIQPVSRPKPTRAFYGGAPWKALMRQIIAQRGRRCEDRECTTPNRAQGERIYGDHIIEIQDGGSLLDENNVLLRCASCHGRKTQQAKVARG